ncbi:alpha/beta hydrolase [Bradyrhizobium elkanii]|uniref:alpha/beta hydrolase n=1 Tax=Bradyrhizobium elkanii TaxID=29448 RepID=UPI003519C8F7
MDTKSQTVPIPRTQQLSLQSSDGQRRYRVFIDVPKEPPASIAGYPVVYLLDGNETFLIAVGAWRLQATAENGYEPAVLVAIGYDDEETSASMRYLDLTPPPKSGIAQNTRDRSAKEVGGAEPYFRFIEEQLKPIIEKQFHVNPARQTLFGHSLGGLFVLYTLFNHPDAFSTYVAGSPSIWWDHRSIYQEAELFSKRSAMIRPGKRLLIAVGSDEPIDMLEDARRTAGILGAAPQLSTCSIEFQGEDHISVIPILISRSVRFILSQDGCPRP